MAFLESLGRSRAITGGLRAISDLKTSELNREILLGQEERAEKKFEFEAEKIEAEKQRRTQPVNVNLHPMFQAFSPEGQKRITEDLRSRGIINAEGVGDIGGLEDYVKEIETTSSLFESIMKPEVVARERQALATVDKLKEEQGKDSPNSKTIQQLQLNVRQATAAAAMTRGNYEKAWNILKTQEADISFEEKEDIKQQHRIELKGVAGAEKSAQNFLVEGEVVLSYDGGRTYIDKGGITRDMPPTGVKITTTTGLQELRTESAREQARGELVDVTPQPTRTPIKAPEEAALEGTGPYRAMAAAFDRLAGGFGADLVFGKRGFFSDTQENRQFLRTVKQLGKAALMNSSRGAVWEQERIDELFPDPNKIFVNPRTEARKFGTVRDVLITTREENNRQITTAISFKEIEKLRDSNRQINRLLALIGETSPETAGGLSPDDEALINKYLREQ